MFEVKKSNYQNGNCRHKQHTRNLLLNLIQEMEISDVNYLGLPSIYPFLEFKILKDYRSANLFLVDNDLKIVNKQKKLFLNKTNPYQEIKFINNDVFNVNTKVPLNVIWLDLCSMFNFYTLNRLQLFLKNNKFQKKGIFAITISAAREQAVHIVFYKLLSKYYNQDYKDLKHFKFSVLPKCISQILSENLNINFVSNNIYPYRSTTKNHMLYMDFTWNINS